jgi:hypothetical protein
MKFKSASITAAMILGVGALLHPTTSVALPTCQTCAYWYAQCQQNPQSPYCASWAELCGICGTPSLKPDTSNTSLTAIRRHALAFDKAEYER